MKPRVPAPANVLQPKVRPVVPPPYLPSARASGKPIQKKTAPVVPPRYVPPPPVRNTIQPRAASAVPPRAVLPRAVPPRAIPIPRGTVQLLTTKTKKRLKNVFTLGIRKAYVEIKRAYHNQAAVAAPAAVVAPVATPVDPYRTNTPALTPIRELYGADDDFTLKELQEHVTAYEKARYFQATKTRNVDSIMKTGLDRKYGGSAEGASAAADPGSIESNKGKIFLGGDRETAQYYERQIRSDRTATPETLRVFLTPEQAETMVGDFGDADNEAYWTSQVDIPAAHILQGRIKTASVEQMTAIFRVVRLWYPHPDQVAVDEVIARHLAAIERGLTAHAYRPGRLDRVRFIRDVAKNPRRNVTPGFDEGYESD